jgi:hypothetical protein
MIPRGRGRSQLLRGSRSKALHHVHVTSSNNQRSKRYASILWRSDATTLANPNSCPALLAFRTALAWNHLPRGNESTLLTDKNRDSPCSAALLHGNVITTDLLPSLAGDEDTRPANGSNSTVSFRCSYFDNALFVNALSVQFLAPSNWGGVILLRLPRTCQVPEAEPLIAEGYAASADRYEVVVVDQGMHQSQSSP